MKKFWDKIGTTEIRNILAVIGVLGAFTIMILLIMKPIPEGNKDNVSQSLGFILGGLVGSIGGYFFGASKQDKDKNEKQV